MIEKIVSVIFPIYGIFMSFIRDDYFELFQYSLAAILGYILLFAVLELGIACFIILFFKIFIDYVAN